MEEHLVMAPADRSALWRILMPIQSRMDELQKSRSYGSFMVQVHATKETVEKQIAAERQIIDELMKLKFAAMEAVASFQPQFKPVSLVDPVMKNVPLT